MGPNNENENEKGLIFVEAIINFGGENTPGFKRRNLNQNGFFNGSEGDSIYSFKKG